MQHEELIKKAAALGRIAPEQWAEFLKAFAEYKEHHRDNLLNSPPNALQINQGKAQMITIAYDLLRGSVESAEQINRKRK